MRMTRPELDDLRTLLAVAEAGSLGRAASRLRRSQPSISRRIQALERSWRLQLLVRSPQGVTLTAEGALVVDWAQRLLDAADEFEGALGTLRAAHEVAVRAAVSMTIAEQFAPSWVGRLVAADSTVTVRLLVHNSAKVVQLVRSGEADLGFVETPTLPADLPARRFAWDRLLVAVHPGHAWASVPHVTASELSHTPLLVRERGSGTRETLQEALAARGLDLVAAVEMDSNTALKVAGVSGAGPVVLSELTIRAELASGQLVAVDVAGVDLRRPLTALWRPEHRMSAGAEALFRIAFGDSPAGSQR